MAQVRVAILGQGRSGRDIHGRSLAKMADRFKIVAVVDDSPERRARAHQEFGCTAYEKYEQLYERDDVDLVVNALPSLQHVPVSLEFLNRGFHVLSEKPLARWTSDVDELIATANRVGKTLAIFQQSRFSPAFVKLQSVVASGVLGRIVQVHIAFNGFARRWDWQTLRAMNGGNLLNTGPHPVDQALQLFGTDVMPEILCRMDQANSFGDAEDYVKLILHGPGRPVVDVEISSCSAYPTDTYQIQGTRGGLVGNTTKLNWRYFSESEAANHQVSTEPLQQADGTPAYCAEELHWSAEEWAVDPVIAGDLFYHMTKTYYTMLHDHLVLGQPLLVTPAEVRQQVAVMEACFRQNVQFDVQHA